MWRWVLSLLVFVSACSQPVKKQNAEPPLEPSDITADALRWADSVASTMSLEEMAGQLLMPSVFARTDKETIEKVKGYLADCHIGGLLLLEGDLESAAAMTDTLQSLSPVGAFVAIDAEWGLRMRLAGTPAFPDNASLGDAADDQLLFDYGREMARECRHVGISMLLGPVADVASGGFLGRRSFGGDPGKVAEFSTAYARGVEAGGVVAVAKHFPGHGGAEGDSHKRLAVNPRDRSQLDSLDLYPFRSLVDGGISAVMIGHISVPELDSTMRPAAVSPVIMQNELRGRMGFRGLIVTDALNMSGADGYDAVDAVLAGADLVLSPQDPAKEFSALVVAVKEGRLPSRVLAERVRRVLFHKYLAGLESPGRGIEAEVNNSQAEEMRSRLAEAAQSRPSSE